MSEETSFYSDQSGVRVTDKRVIIKSTTYSLANITSVSTRIEYPGQTGPLLFMAIGALVLIGGFGGRGNGGMAVFGLVLGLAGYFWYRGNKPTWHLRISSASGESTPLSSQNQQWIEGIARAINEAIIHRA